MAEPTITDVFGPGATQTATSITILKSDLPTLTAIDTNRGEQLFMGIVLRAQQNLTTAARDADLSRSIAIEPSFDQVTSRTVGAISNNYYQSGLTITAQKINANSAIDADDY
jgi:hypothetical protein